MDKRRTQLKAGLRQMVLLSLLLMGCREMHTAGEPEEEAVFERADALFVTGEGEEGQVQTVFATNDEKYWTYEGLTLWTVWGEAETLNSRKVEMGKPIGYSGGGYGIVFSQGEYEVAGVKQPAMLVVMVNNEGYYITGKAVGGSVPRFWVVEGEFAFTARFRGGE